MRTAAKIEDDLLKKNYENAIIFYYFYLFLKFNSKLKMIYLYIKKFIPNTD